MGVAVAGGVVGALHVLQVSTPFTYIHCKKRFASFPSPAGVSLPNCPWAGIMTS
jgi:hypothetical protein